MGHSAAVEEERAGTGRAQHPAGRQQTERSQKSGLCRDSAAAPLFWFIRVSAPAHTLSLKNHGE